MTTTFAEASHPDTAAERNAAKRETRIDNHETHTAALRELAMEIEAHRLTRRPQPSQNAWVKEYPGLGSQKTYSRIIEGRLEEISIPAQLPKYRAVASLLKSAALETQKEELYDDLAGTEACVLQALKLIHYSGPNRFMEIKGGNGTGKTSTLKVIQEKLGADQVKIVEANDTWKSIKEFLCDTLGALGMGREKINALRTNGERFRELCDLCPRGKFLLAFDEAHHMTGQILNLIKSLMNRTGLRVIAAGINTLMQKLKASAAEEAKQLFQNRLFCSIALGGPDEAGLRGWLTRRLGAPGAWRAATLNSICREAPGLGAWSLARRIAEHLQNGGITDPDDADLLAAFASAKTEVIS